MKTMTASHRIQPLWLAAACLAAALLPGMPALARHSEKPDTSLFDRTNLIAWCIVPFDAARRTPAERAEMLDRLGIHRFAYDWREEHLSTFADELDQLRSHQIELTALWFPSTLDDTARMFLAEIQKRGLHPQLWVMGSGAPVRTAAEHELRIASEVDRIRPIAEAAQAIGCQVGLYNHGGWFGEPENQIAIIERLDLPNVGIVYNLHHGHAHLDRFETLLKRMKPHLLALNLNGMNPDGETSGQKILPIGSGTRDLDLLHIIIQSGWRGPVGILNHTDLDAETRLRENLDGLARLVGQLEAQSSDHSAPPPLPLGDDAFRQWHLWPQQRIGLRTHMRSTYDRSGNNERADASHYLYQLADDRNVSLDVGGPGVLCFVRTNHWHGSPWHYDVDGVDHLIQETGTADPVNAKTRFQTTEFLPPGLFPEPLAWTWTTTKGADLSWVPIPFHDTLRLAYERTFYGTGYYIYQQYDSSAPLTTALPTWDGETPPPADVLNVVGQSAASQLPTPDGADWARQAFQRDQGRLQLAGSEPTALWESNQAPRQIRALELRVAREQALELGQCVLRITWDDRPEPSVECPVALFFGAGRLYSRDQKPDLVKAFPATIRFDAETVHLSCAWPMPFFRSARVELIAPAHAPDLAVDWSVTTAACDAAPAYSTYFHATYRDIPAPEPGLDMTLLDTQGIEGVDVWSGQFTGMSWIFSHAAVLNTLEGDPRFFFDDSQTPQGQGTGTEEWGGGGDYWGGRTMTLPFAGHPVGARKASEALDETDLVNSAYRFLLSDLMPFGRRAIIRLEHGGTNESKEHYESVVYWYGAPAPALELTDELDVGSHASEVDHAYSCTPEAPIQSLTSRFEWGPDVMGQRELYPTQTENGRAITAESGFTLRLNPDNWGVLLRRRLDYAYPNQRARIEVADASGPEIGPFEPAGTWYLAGSNTCVFSNPKDELGETQHVVQTSNRRLRDDEFIIPRSLTRGREAIRVRVRFEKCSIPLFPGQIVPEERFSELRYWAYCWVTPRWNP